MARTGALMVATVGTESGRARQARLHGDQGFGREGHVRAHFSDQLGMLAP